MSASIDPKLGVNSWLEDELYQQYLHDRRTVDESWKEVFESDGHTGQRHENGTPAAPVVSGPTVQAQPAPAPAPAPAAPAPAAGEELVPLRGAASRIAENMTASLSIPVATSQRTIAVMVIDENRRVINQHRTLHGQGKISYTHLIAWAIVQALQKNPAVNMSYAEVDGTAYRRVRKSINIGIAVDVAGKDGSRSLTVPNIKGAEQMNFADFANAFDDVVARARTGKLTIADFEGTTVSLTNPGTVGTNGSIPRLMSGQGADHRHRRH